MVFSVAKFKSRTPLMNDSHSGEISYYTYRCAYILSNYLCVFHSLDFSNYDSSCLYSLCSLKSTADCINCTCTVDSLPSICLHLYSELLVCSVEMRRCRIYQNLESVSIKYNEHYFTTAFRVAIIFLMCMLLLASCMPVCLCVCVCVCVCMYVSVSLYKHPVNHATFIRASVGVFFTCTSLILPQPNTDTYNNKENNLKCYKNCVHVHLYTSLYH